MLPTDECLVHPRNIRLDIDRTGWKQQNHTIENPLYALLFR
jgi:hypothetical protein